jgi:hypothetical protein
VAGYPVIFDLSVRPACPEWVGLVELVARLRPEKLTSPEENVYCYKVLADLLDTGLA